MVNAAQTVDVQTGDPDWDAALAFSQKTAFSLFFGPSQSLPSPSFVISRQPDQGHSARVGMAKIIPRFGMVNRRWRPTTWPAFCPARLNWLPV